MLFQSPERIIVVLEKTSECIYQGIRPLLKRKLRTDGGTDAGGDNFFDFNPVTVQGLEDSDTGDPLDAGAP